MITAYQERNRKLWEQSNGRVGTRVILAGKDEAPFWSIGWMGCRDCGRDLTESHKLEFFSIIRNGETTTGWTCYESIQRRQEQGL